MSRRMIASAALTAALILTSCGRPPLPADLEQIHHPDLSTVEASAREQLEGQRQQLSKALSRGDASELATAYGDMGELYHAYRLLPPAAACYRNAERLDSDSFLWPYYLGLLLHEEGDFAAAVASFDRALERDGDHLTARLRRGQAYLASGDAEAASADFEAASADPQLIAAAEYGLGRAAVTRGDAQAALRHFERVLKLEPRAGIVQHALGLVHRQLGNDEEADRYLTAKGDGEVPVPDPLRQRLDSLAISSGAWLRRGNQALLGGRESEAIEAFQQAVAANPDDVEARRSLALALKNRQEFAAAIRQLEAAVEIDAASLWLHFDLGNAYLADGKGEAAITAFERAIELAPDFTSAYFNLANALAAAERWSDARPHLQKVIEFEPGHRQARYLLAMARHRQGQSDTAARELAELVAEAPAEPVFRQGWATVLTESRQLAQAEAAYLGALDLDLTQAEKTRYLFQLAELAWQQRHQDDAVEYYRRAVELSPESSLAHTNLGNVLQLLDRRREAIDSFARAVELDDDNATAWLSEGTLWILEGQYRKASERLAEGLAANGDHAGLANTLARLLATCPDGDIRDGRRAADLARRAYAIEPTLENAETLGMAMAELGQFEEAVRWQRSLMNEAVRTGQQHLLRSMAIHLQHYERREPIRISSER